MTWVVRTQLDFGWGDLNLRIARKGWDGTYEVVMPFQFKSFTQGEHVDVVTIPAAGVGPAAKEFLQAIVDHAAEIGIVPTNKAPPTKEIEALRYHLEDMRKLVFKTPNGK